MDYFIIGLIIGMAITIMLRFIVIMIDNGEFGGNYQNGESFYQ